MLLNSLRLFFVACLWSLLLAACGGGGSGGSSASPPAGFLVAPGDGQVTVTWTTVPGVDYWIMYAPTATSINLKSPPGVHYWLNNVSSPLVVTGLSNSQAYSFAMDARINGGPGGAQTASLTTTPRLGGGTGTWASAPGLDAARNFKGLAYGTASDASLNYIAVGSGGSIYKSIDGAGWTRIALNISVGFNAASYAFGKFVAVGSGTSNNIVSSTDLATWTPATTAVVGGLNAMATDGTTLVAVGDSGKLWYSTDALVWTDASVNSVSAPLYGVGYMANGTWLAVGQGGVMLTSNNGRSWTVSSTSAGATPQSLRAVASLGSTWVAVGDNGTILISLDSGASWSVRSVASGPTLYAVNGSNTTVDAINQFLAVGAGGAAYTSADGLNWSSQTSGVTAPLYGLLGSAVLYLAVGASGTAVTAK
jgi:hypothetical protein